MLVAPTRAAERALDVMRLREIFATAADLPSARHLIESRARQAAAAVTPRTAAAASPLTWHGEILAVNVDEVWERTKAYISQFSAAQPEAGWRIVIDLADVRFIDSSGLGLMVRTRKFVERQNGTLRFVGVQPAVRNVIQLARLGSFLQYS